MLGAIWGDLIGSPYEYQILHPKTKDFPLLSPQSRFTDDSVMSLAVADGLMKVPSDAEDDAIRQSVIDSMQTIGQRYPDRGYGGNFIHWIFSSHPAPYNSYGNGSAMRVSSVGWLFDDQDRVLHVARLTAEVSHNHPEGIKGAQAIADAVFLARTGHSKEEIKTDLTQRFHYDLDRTCDQIRPGYQFDVSCQGSVPEAILAFLEGHDFEDTIRTAVSLGGDSDTIGAMAGSIAEGFYQPWREERWYPGIQSHLTPDLWEILERFLRRTGR